MAVREDLDDVAERILAVDETVRLALEQRQDLRAPPPAAFLDTRGKSLDVGVDDTDVKEAGAPVLEAAGARVTGGSTNSKSSSATPFPAASCACLQEPKLGP